MATKEAFNTPILLLWFNRPELAARTLDRVRTAMPTALYIAIDGARTTHPQDLEKVAACRALITLVDWPCTVHTLFRAENLGCRRAVSSAITWFFEHVEAGIILEDDCLPDLTFFDFCQVLLQRYVNEPKIMHIGGANLYGNRTWGADAYFFSSIPHIWGWATWRRAWKLYDVSMKEYPEFKRLEAIKQMVTYAPSRSYWEKAFDKTYSGKIDTWDYQWVFAIWKHQGLCIIPNQNLITNIGFGEGATNTLADSEFANMPTVPIEVNLISHPEYLIVNKEATNYAFAQFYQLTSWWKAKLNSIKRGIHQSFNIL